MSGMTAQQFNLLLNLAVRLFSPRPRLAVSEWCEQNLSFNEPGCTGPFSFAGREYLREPLDSWGEPNVTDQVTVFATRTGKTRILYGGTGWLIANSPARVLYVKPKSNGAAGASDDARTRFIPMLRASPVLSEMIPYGSKRHDFKTAQQIIGGSIIDWTGSNSVAALASNPCRVVIQDEVDKFNTTRKRDDSGKVVEADASSLADERCKEFSNPKRFKASTPTLFSGRIWQELLKSDLRRYFMPCPHCAKDVLFAWSKDFTTLPLTGCEAFVKWDGRRPDGTWDLDTVELTAHAECPHCTGKILDTHKSKMVREGKWKATQSGSPGYRGYHLPSMYAAHRETSFGRLAVKFLQCKNQHQGLRGFINSDLAEPYMNQDRMKAVQVIINRGIKKNREGIPDRTVRLGAADYQRGTEKKGELRHWWKVIFDIKRHDDGRIHMLLVDEGKELTDANLVASFAEHNVDPSCVIVDSGWESDHVKALCMGHGYYCLKMEGEKRMTLFSGHDDGGKKIYAVPRVLHKEILNCNPKYDYIPCPDGPCSKCSDNGGYVPDPREPMYFQAAKYPLMDFFMWLRQAPHVKFEVPGDVSDDFKTQLNSWGKEDSINSDGSPITKWKQYNPADHMFQLCCYVALLMMDMELIEWGTPEKRKE